MGRGAGRDAVAAKPDAGRDGGYERDSWAALALGITYPSGTWGTSIEISLWSLISMSPIFKTELSPCLPYELKQAGSTENNMEKRLLDYFQSNEQVQEQYYWSMSQRLNKQKEDEQNQPWESLLQSDFRHKMKAEEGLEGEQKTKE